VFEALLAVLLSERTGALGHEVAAASPEAEAWRERIRAELKAAPRGAA